MNIKFGLFSENGALICMYVGESDYRTWFQIKIRFNIKSI